MTERAGPRDRVIPGPSVVWRRLTGRVAQPGSNGAHPDVGGAGQHPAAAATPPPGEERTEPLTIPRPRLGGRARPAVLAAIAAGGALGAPARYLLGKAVHVSAGTFPWGTFWINLSGCFALGLLLTFVLERWPPTRFIRPFAAVGFLGAYTTFSTFGVEADLLISAGRIGIAAAYVAASLVGGLAAAYLGITLGRLWPRGGGQS